jgi:hypothetical protein
MRKLHSLSPSDLSTNRRQFLRQAAGMGLLTAARGLSPLGAQALSKLPVNKRKTIMVTFGGGARDQETFDLEGQENIPTSSRSCFLRPPFILTLSIRASLGTMWPQQVLSQGRMSGSTILPMSRLSTQRSSNMFVINVADLQRTRGSLRPATASTASGKVPTCRFKKDRDTEQVSSSRSGCLKLCLLYTPLILDIYCRITTRVPLRCRRLDSTRHA